MKNTRTIKIVNIYTKNAHNKTNKMNTRNPC